MTRSELILRLAESNPQLYQRDLENIVDTIFNTIAEAIADGRRVELRGFGAFWAKERKARTARNPRTGASVTVKAKRTPFFKAGKPLKELLNGSTEDKSGK
jgi:integration host factor subunit beta